MAATWNYLRENVTAVKNFAEYVAPGEKSAVDDLKPGEGAIVRQGLQKVAAYRDNGGTILKRVLCRGRPGTASNRSTTHGSKQARNPMQTIRL